MGEHKLPKKPQISVLIASRGRPDQCRRTVESLRRNAGNCRVEIIVGVDEDDATSGEYAELGIRDDLDLYFFPRHRTLGALNNALAALTSGDYLLSFPDDYVIETPEWGAKILETGARLPNGIGVLYLDDQTHPGFTTFPVITRQVYEAVGYFFPPFFPYWFSDTWWDEIGTLLSAKLLVPARVAAPEGRGRTHGLVDFPFWLDVFESTRPLRVKDAITLAVKGFGEEAARRGVDSPEFARRQQLCEQRVAHLRDPRLQAAFADAADSPPGPHYAAVKAQAEEIVRKVEQIQPNRLRVAICIPSDHSWMARTGMAVAALTAFTTAAGVEVAVMGMEGSMITNSRNTLVEFALGNKCSHIMWIDGDMKFPPDTILRLLNHNKDVVGAIYNKKVAPYTTLGRLMGDRVPEVMPDLHEAKLLPGGLMLVKADVYRKIGWPAYWETYDWRAKASDGYAGFKLMMRNLFASVPSEEVLGSLDETPFAVWMKDNFVIGEDEQPVLIFSEDYNFCRKARRAGFQIWADMKLSQEVTHLGLQEVSCVLAEPTLTKEAAE